MEKKENCRTEVNIEYEINAGGRRIINVQDDLNDALKNILTEQSYNITSLKVKIVNVSA